MELEILALANSTDERAAAKNSKTGMPMIL